MSTPSRLTVERDEHRVATVTLRRPEVLNAMDSVAHRELGEAVADLERDDGVGAIVIRGEGRAFCSGSDLREIGTLTGRAEQEYVELDFSTKNRVAASRVPVVAAIGGHCVGGGLELALACTVRVAADDARFALPEVTLGSLPGSGGLQRLAPLVGLGVATDWVLTGRTVAAQEAYDRGLVTHLVPRADLDRTAYDLAAELATKSPLALRLAMVALRPDPPADRSLVATFQALAGDATHREPGYARATAGYRRTTPEQREPTAGHTPDAAEPAPAIREEPQ